MPEVELSKWPVIGVIILLAIILIPLIVVIVNLSSTNIILNSVTACNTDDQVKNQAYPAIRNGLIATVLTGVGILVVIILAAYYLYRAQSTGYKTVTFGTKTN